MKLVFVFLQLLFVLVFVVLQLVFVFVFLQLVFVFLQLGPTLSRLPANSGNPEDLGREIQLQNNVARYVLFLLSIEALNDMGRRERLAMSRELFSRLMIEDKQFRWALEDSLTKPSMNLN